MRPRSREAHEEDAKEKRLKNVFMSGADLAP
jgi:hypothetical protein